MHATNPLTLPACVLAACLPACLPVHTNFPHPVSSAPFSAALPRLWNLHTPQLSSEASEHTPGVILHTSWWLLSSWRELATKAISLNGLKMDVCPFLSESLRNVGDRVFCSNGSPFHSPPCPMQHLNMFSATENQILNVTQLLFIGSKLNNATTVGITALGHFCLQA